MTTKPINIEPSEILDYFYFLFYNGVIQKDSNGHTEREPNGSPKMQPKKASISCYVKGFRSSENLKIEGIETIFFNGLFITAEEKILIPFNTEGAKKGLEIDLIFCVQKTEEEASQSWKLIPIRNFHFSGGLISMKELFLCASLQHQPTDIEKKLEEEEHLENNIDWIEHKFSNTPTPHTYKIEKIGKNFEIRNWSNHQKLLSPKSPKYKAIFKLSKFYIPAN